MRNSNSRKLKRVLVTGLGLVSPLGIGVKQNWTNLLSGKCGIKLLTDPKYAQLPCRIAATIPDISVDQSALSSSDYRQLSPASRYGWLAAREAWKDSGRTVPVCDQDDTRTYLENTGVAFGEGMVDLDDVHLTGELVKNNKYRKVSPYFVPRLLTNMGAGAISLRLGLGGPNHSVSTACTTGAHSIGDAYNMIRMGMAQVMVCGGADACISPISLAGFARCRALSTAFHESPENASRPFDASRDGFVMGEGAGVVILESFDHYMENNGLDRCTPYAEIIGYGDAYHMTSPDPSGRGARLCMKRAISDAQISPCQVGHINAHATSTPMGDLIEASAIKSIFGSRPDLIVTSTKGHTGHLLGGAGAVEAIFAIMALSTKTIPRVLNLENLEPELEELEINIANENNVDWTHNSDGDLRIAMSNSFGFGGTNASLCFAQVDDL